jgi:hypothetical protein
MKNPRQSKNEDMERKTTTWMKEIESQVRVILVEKKIIIFLLISTQRDVSLTESRRLGRKAR